MPAAVRRVVSLVPSLTESVALSAPGLLVGATDWCTHPVGLEAARIGGTKNPRVADIADLQPDVVLANEEENRAPDLDALRALGVPVWVTAPETVAAALVSLDRMLGIACALPRPAWLDEAAAVWASSYDGRRQRAVVPIWRRPWMFLGRDTFAGDLLRLLGVDNVLSGHAERYPRVEPETLPSYDLVVLPDEPYAFSPSDGPEAFTGRQTRCVSGRHLTWYGPSLLEAPGVLAAQLSG